ncbi:hypothetical protein Tco_0823673 [Tanacetum coccineum]|uniref:Uncharacterized protein n=1 Tax=Tanacetum coccineum TaxID=301880 RepID=A0ABQ5AN66_9ASTR
MMTGDSGCWPDMVVWMIMTMDGGVDVVGELAVGCCWLNVRRMLAGSGGILAGNGGGPDSQWVRVRGACECSFESSDENEVTEVKALMALTDEERVSVERSVQKIGDWPKISIKRNLVQELNTCKEQLLVLKQAKLVPPYHAAVKLELLKRESKLKT